MKTQGKDKMRELERICRELAQFEDEHLPVYVTSDPTVEKMAILMHENTERLGLFSAEPTPFAVLGGLYTQGIPNLELVLQAHSGDHVRHDRVGRDSLILRHPALTMCLMIQPDVLAQLRQKRLMIASGFLARFIFVAFSYREGQQDIKAQVSTAAASDYRAMLERLMRFRPEEPVVLKLTEPARNIFWAFKNDLELRCRDGDLSAPGLEEWGAKLAGETLRLAALIHLSEGKTGATIESQTMERAIRLARCLVSHARHAFGLLGSDPAVHIAKRICGWLVRSKKAGFSKREVWQALKGTGLSSVADLEGALHVCVEHGIIRRKPAIAAWGKGGRPSDVFEVNPSFLTNAGGSGGIGGGFQGLGGSGCGASEVGKE